MDHYFEIIMVIRPISKSCYLMNEAHITISQFFLNMLGHSLAVQWLELGAFTARARVQSLVRELRSHKL